MKSVRNTPKEHWILYLIDSGESRIGKSSQCLQSQRGSLNIYKSEALRLRSMTIPGLIIALSGIKLEI